jgi:hypothetical protein
MRVFTAQATRLLGVSAAAAAWWSFVHLSPNYKHLAAVAEVTARAPRPRGDRHPTPAGATTRWSSVPTDPLPFGHPIWTPTGRRPRARPRACPIWYRRASILIDGVLRFVSFVLSLQLRCANCPMIYLTPNPQCTRINPRVHGFH